jgi:hypothetical protein
MGLLESGRRARGDGGDLRKPLSEGLLGAISRRAEETADMQPDVDGFTLAG